MLTFIFSVIVELNSRCRYTPALRWFNNSPLWRRPCSAVAWSGSEHSHIRLLLLFVLCGLTAFRLLFVLDLHSFDGFQNDHVSVVQLLFPASFFTWRIWRHELFFPRGDETRISHWKYGQGSRARDERFLLQKRPH